MTEQNTETQERIQVPKFRLDQESQKRKELQGQYEELLKEFDTLKSERDSEESEKDQKRGEFEKIAERERKKREAAEEEVKSLKTAMLRKDQRAAFYEAARGVIRSEAVADAFSMLSTEDLDSTDATDEDTFKKMAQSLAESKTYLADTPQGAGSGRGAGRPVALVGQQDGAKKPLPYGKFNKRKIT